MLVMANLALKFVSRKRGSNTYVEAFLLANFKIPMLNSRLRQP